MGILELMLIILIIGAFAGRGYFALGVILDIFIAILVVVLVVRLVQVLL
ncbi:MAG TPA: hypothetical protein VF209_00110 [Patescibacteria group bacterium]